jgi:thioredoxin-related protein
MKLFSVHNIYVMYVLIGKEKCNHCNILKRILEEKEKSNTALKQENASGSKILGIYSCVIKKLKIIIHHSTTQGMARVV